MLHFIAAIGYMLSIAFSAYRAGSIDVLFGSEYGGIMAIFGIIIVLGVWASIWLLIIRKLNDAFFYRKSLGPGSLTFRVIVWLLIYFCVYEHPDKLIVFCGKVKGRCTY